MTTPARRHDIAALSAARCRVALLLTGAMMFCYFGFILLVAYNKPLMGRELTGGLSVGILLGALVILAAWCLVWIYTHWANRHYDARVSAMRTPPGR